MKNIFCSSKTDILYDYQTFDLQKMGGISRYFCEIIRKMHLNTDISVRYSQNYYLRHWRLGKHYFHAPISILDRYHAEYQSRNRKLAIKLLTKKDFSLFHPTYYDPYFLEYLDGRPYVITVHDMIHEIFPHMFGDAATLSEHKKEIVTHASRIIAISENTRNDIIKYLGISPLKLT